MKNKVLKLSSRPNSSSVFSSMRPSVFAAVASLGILITGCSKDAPSLPREKLADAATVNGIVSTALQPVSLGTAGTFTILTETGISTTGVTTIQGDIGTSPIASTALTGFGLAMSADQSFSTSSLITGKAYGPEYAGATPGKMTAAISDMEAAFDKASALIPTQPLESFAGDISGQKLAPGVYNWAAGLLIADNSSVTLTGSSSDVYIFQIGTGFTVGSNTKIILGNVLASNVFWIVGSAATFGTNADFSGIILAKTLVSLNTGDVVTGRLYAQTAVTMIADAVSTPPVPVVAPVSVIGQLQSSLPVLFNNVTISFTMYNQTKYVTTGYSSYSSTSNSYEGTLFTIQNAGNGKVIINSKGTYGLTMMQLLTTNDPYNPAIVYYNLSFASNYSGQSPVITASELFTMTSLGGNQYTLQDANGNSLAYNGYSISTGTSTSSPLVLSFSPYKSQY